MSPKNKTKLTLSSLLIASALGSGLWWNAHRNTPTPHTITPPIPIAKESTPIYKPSLGTTPPPKKTVAHAHKHKKHPHPIKHPKIAKKTSSLSKETPSYLKTGLSIPLKKQPPIFTSAGLRLQSKGGNTGIFADAHVLPFKALGLSFSTRASLGYNTNASQSSLEVQLTELVHCNAPTSNTHLYAGAGISMQTASDTGLGVHALVGASQKVTLLLPKSSENIDNKEERLLLELGVGTSSQKGATQTDITISAGYQLSF